MKKNKPIFKLSLLSMSLLTGSATAITGILPVLKSSYPNVSQSLIESLVTLPSLTILIFTLLSSFVAKKIGNKQTVQLGLMIALVGGVTPFFITNFTALLIMCLVFGVGIGLFTPLAISLISMFFEGDERANLLGYQLGTMALGNALLIFLSGMLLKHGWNVSFLVYLLIIPVYLFVTFNIPEPPVSQDGFLIKTESSKTSIKLNKEILFLIVLCFFTFLIIWIVQLKMPLIFAERGLNKNNPASLVLSLMNVGGLVAGLLFGRAFVLFRHKLLPLGYLLAGMSILFISLSRSGIMIAFWAIFFNFIYSFTGPYIILKVNQISPRSLLTLSTALISVSMTLSQLVTPFFWNGLGALIGIDSASMIIRLAGGFAFIIGGILSLRLIQLKRVKND
ncbi:hypothetical protein CKN73_08965 [Carnobacterium divergens]|uniref:MFS transporter n=1 Tax=Carnobacterium divergens TaxID=2748 RepID=UPI001072ECB8|nr:MFS transporter [Carnobacterium divergens]TFJ40435.1 hypothetical protein CKN77_09065 [Carnobacterium divergens]TFJ49055.1 hypothetical protein CKN73_08965 [Carnobacterium divergens]TFJ54319.1 hypothetical protein CKN83_08870 [Carnobacterium divergens]TFJ59845.1 hypothetical protein CKN89_09310 [Carnobacterium divergens]TFJ70489.1 hypothetical protein CKN91_08925 [Carnobacterium divergens]